ncbi:VCBS domain-containing protein [Yoonia sp. R2331]|uniref:VCBS domain-containing protein n=1 Tax=Yoonia sp. R2331 TaxID=3237238 RepID=UPI0034E45F1A
MASSSFIIYGDVNVAVTITENMDGTLTFTTSVITQGENATGLIGDINALFFDVADNIDVSLLETSDGTDLGSTGLDTVLLEDAFKEESITKVDSFTNMNGEVIKEAGKFDGGVQFGTQGIGTDDYQSVSFTLSTSDGSALSLADFSMQDFGVRLTSVGVEGGSRDGSLKLGTTAPLFPVDPPVEPGCDDIYITTEADFSAPILPGFPPLPGDQIVDPDTQDAFFSLLYNNEVGSSVTSVGGDASNVGQVITGSNGGTIVIYADGTFDFSALNTSFENDFAHLNDNDVETTTFVYEVDGLEQTLCVEVHGITDDGGPGGPNG